MPSKVTVIDYGVGNLLSVQRALEHCGAEAILTSDPKIIQNAERIVLPGVGAFPNAMETLHELKLVTVIQEFAFENKPLLAICLGMQLLMEESDEFKTTTGLGIIPGRVIPVPNQTLSGETQKIPIIGWNALRPSSEVLNWEGSLLENNRVEDFAYFVHSYMAIPSKKENLLAEVIVGGHKISAVTVSGSVTGCQFHPEKSGEVGLKILRKFLQQ
jgi:glutamine amidotransferase